MGFDKDATEWQTAPVSDLAELAIGPFGSALTRDLYVESGMPLVSGGNLRGMRWPDLRDAPRVATETSQRLLRSVAVEGDLVFPHRGSIGRVAIADRPMMLSTSMMRARFDTDVIDPEFAYWYFVNEGNDELLTMASSVGTPGIGQPLASLRSVRVRFPTLDRQKTIAEVLGALDDKIAANRRVVASGDQLTAAVVSPQLRERARLHEAVDFTFGDAFKGESFTAPGEGRPLIRIRDLKSQRCQVWTSERRPRERVVTPGEVLVGMDAEFRATRWSGPIGVLNQRVLLGRNDTYGDALVREILIAPLARIERSKSGTTVIHLNKRDLEGEYALVPPPSEVSRIRALIDPVWRRCIAAEKEQAALAATRDELLPLLMSGRITVKDAERRVEEEL